MTPTTLLCVPGHEKAYFEYLTSLNVGHARPNVTVNDVVDLSTGNCITTVFVKGRPVVERIDTGSKQVYLTIEGDL
jgi:hypothetical protein